MSAPPAGPYLRANGGITMRETARDGSLLLGVFALLAAAVLGGVIGWFTRRT